MSDVILVDFPFQQKMNFIYYVNKYFWYEPHLIRFYAKNIIQRYVMEEEMMSILDLGSIEVFVLCKEYYNTRISGPQSINIHITFLGLEIIIKDNGAFYGCMTFLLP